MPDLVTSLIIQFLVHLVRNLLIVALAWATYGLLKRLIPRIVDATLWIDERYLPQPPEELAKRRETLTSVLTRTLRWVLIVVAGFAILGEMGVNILPLLAGAGVLGIAVAFGSQSLIRDIISGVFILLEDFYRQGDIITAAGVTGRVEDVNLRRTVLRDLDGTVHIIPNGSITTVSNRARGWSLVDLSIRISYASDLNKAIETVDRVGKVMAADPYFGAMITEAPHFERIESLSDSTVELKILGITKPTAQVEVMGELRRRLLVALGEAKVQPFAQNIVESREKAAEGAG